MKKNKYLSDILPIYKVEQDCILSKQGDVTVAYELTLPELFTLGTPDFEAIHHGWLKAIRVLPSGVILHKQDWFVECTYQADFSNPDKTFLSRSSERFFHERPYLDHRCYLFLTQKPAGRHAATASYSALVRPSLAPALTLDPRLKEAFLDKAGQFAKILQNAGYISVRRMTDEELASSEDKPGLLERYCYLLHPQQSPVLRDMSITPDLRVGTLHCQLFSLADTEDLPSLCGPRVNYDKYSTDRTKFSTSFAAPLGQMLPVNHIYNQYLFIEDAQATMKKMEAKRLRLQSLSAYSRQNAISREATDQFLNEAVSQDRQPIKAHFNILTWCEHADQMGDARNAVSAALAQINARAHQETACAPQLFWAAMPGNAAELPIHETFDTFAEQATCFFNQETNYRTSLSPVGLRLGDRLHGYPVHVDISDEPITRGICSNRNKFILGGSGSGKSFFTNLYLRSYLEQGAHAIVVDVGHSYKGLCQLLDGYYFTFDEKNPIRFNPFWLGDDILDTEKKESIKVLLLSLWKKDDESYSRSEYISLSNALQAYFDHLQGHAEVFPCFDTFYIFLRDSFLVTLKADGIKEKDFDVDNFLYVLRPYFQGGEYDYLLNAHENLDLLNKRLIIFELDNLADHPILFSATTIIIMQAFINKMRKLKGVRKIILIEEAWKALMRAGMSEYIKYLFKTVRKFFGEAVVVTQEIEDIISSPIVKTAIIANADCKILLDQSKFANRFDFIQDLLGLSDKDKALVLSINKDNDPKLKYKEVFIGLGGASSKVYRTEVAPEEYLTYTTEEKEKMHVQAYSAKHGSIQRGIEMLARDQRKAA